MLSLEDLGVFSTGVRSTGIAQLLVGLPEEEDPPLLPPPSLLLPPPGLLSPHPFNEFGRPCKPKPELPFDKFCQSCESIAEGPFCNPIPGVENRKGADP